MNRHPLRGLFEVALMQLGWWAAVLGAAWGWPLFGPMAVALLLIPYLWDHAERGRALELFVVLGVGGLVIDSLLAALGLISFVGSSVSWLAPPWIVALWVQFATSRETLLASLRDRPWIAAVVGAVGGPLAYGAGVRLGAASFPAGGTELSLLALALVWGLVLPWATWFTYRDQGALRRPIIQTVEEVS